MSTTARAPFRREGIGGAPVRTASATIDIGRGVEVTAPAARRYRPEIDGLRGVAVAMAVLFHAEVAGFHGGFAGADIFFVISGYLIAEIVLRESKAGTFSFMTFYERRVRRIMPALLTMLVISSGASLILLPDDFLAYGKSLVAIVFFVSNVYFWKDLGYFGINPDAAPLLPTWSLSVEEQLYLVFPLLIAVAARFGRRIVIALVFISIAGGLAAGTFVNGMANAAFFFPFFRSVEFLVGVLLAIEILPQPKLRWAGDALAGLGLVLIACAAPMLHRSPYFPAPQVLLASTGTALVLYGASTGTSFVARLLSMRPLVLLGLASYSLYLWHWPFLAFGTYYVLDPSQLPAAKMALAAISVPVAFISWRFVELPFRGRNPLLSRRGAFLTTAAISLSLAAFGALAVALNGMPGRFDPAVQRIVEDRTRSHNPCNLQSPESVAQGKLCKIGDPAAEPSFFILGDSHADMYYEALGELALGHGVSGYMISAPNCRSYLLDDSEPAGPGCAARNREVHKLIQALRPKAVVLSERWNVSTVAVRADAANDPRGAEWLEAFSSGLDEMAGFVAAAGAELYIVEDTPEAAHEVTRTLARAQILGTGEEAPALLRLQPTRAEYDALESVPDASFEELASRHAITFLAPQDLLCDQERCRVSLDGLPLFRDKHHLNQAGARYVMPAFEPLMDHLTKP